MGQAAKLDTTGKLIISYYEHRIVYEKRLTADGGTEEVAKIKYRTRFEPVTKERLMGDRGFNQEARGVPVHFTSHA